MKKLPVTQDQFTIIIDANNITNDNSHLGTLKYQVDSLQSHYPERLHKLFAVNMSWVAKTIWYAVKPFVKESTRNKLVLIGDNSDEIFNSMKEEIDINIIPIEFGGENKIF